MSKLFSLNWRDIGEMALFTLLVTVVTAVYPTFSSGEFPTALALLAALKAGVTGAVAAFLKALLTNSEGKPLTSEKK